ncbi:hypothetical protein NVP1063O_087 [Vibrio phage 1.063.O._10N.261.45.C7]|nr:hypothetical protein NVP1063O_087 [Vibrio phage 1.063.O._10N.261.45.C7]
MPYINFKHVVAGVTLLVEADVTYVPNITSCRHTAACRDDLHYELEVHDLGIYSEDGSMDLTEVVNISDQVFVREIELQMEEDSVDYTQMNEINMYEEAEYYYGEG